MISAFINLANNFGLLPKSRYKNLVNGLREVVPPSEVRVYRANPDGTRGKFLRIDPPPEYPYFKRGKK